ncbi:NagD-like phosphatase [Cutibacterium acnes JCM 18909]|nr:NagD-like phosphatase [Cutibacterium acnes JCM 18909]
MTVDKLGVMRDPADIECWLTDMDGVLVHENHEVPGASDLINRWVDTSKRFLVLTNNSIFTPRDLAARMQASGLTVPEDNIWTSALATAHFLADQQPGARLYVIGEAGLTTALHEAGLSSPTSTLTTSSSERLVPTPLRPLPGPFDSSSTVPGLSALTLMRLAPARRARCLPPVPSPR